MQYKRMNLEDAKYMGRSNDIDSVWYIGSPALFSEFCKFAYTNWPNLQYLKIYNLGISEIPDRLMNRLHTLDCSYNPIKNLRFGPDLRMLIAPGTDLKLIDVLYSLPTLNYLKIGHIENNTRITIDTTAEYIDFRSYYTTRIPLA